MPSVRRRPRSAAAPVVLAPIALSVAIGALAVLAVPTTTVRAADHAIQIADSAFRPATLTVAVGDTVTWTNVDDRPHTATAGGGAFDSGNLDPGQSFSMTFTTAGTFAYACEYHPDMRATIVVVPAAAAPAAAPAAPQAAAPDAPTAATNAPAAQAAQDAPAHHTGPDTAVASPNAPVLVPGVLAGVGLLFIAVAVVPRRVAATAAALPRRGGWRR